MKSSSQCKHCKRLIPFKYVVLSDMFILNELVYVLCANRVGRHKNFYGMQTPDAATFILISEGCDRKMLQYYNFLLVLYS